MRITHSALRQIVAIAADRVPQECCGTLLGPPSPPGHRIVLAVAMRNVAADPVRRFRIDPDELAAVSRRFRDDGLDVVGFFHSHPKGAARPSRADIAASASWPGYYHAIAAHEQHGWSLRTFISRGPWWDDCEMAVTEG